MSFTPEPGSEPGPQDLQNGHVLAHWASADSLCWWARPQSLMGGGVGDTAPVGLVTESVVRAAETREGSLVLLPDAIPCTVSFTRGAEKSVLLGVHGLPLVPPALHMGSRRGWAALQLLSGAQRASLC